MTDALSSESHSIVQVRLAWILRATCVKQRLTGMKQERYLEAPGFTRGSECHKFFLVIADVVRSIFCTYKIEACPRSACGLHQTVHVSILTADEARISFF